MTDESLQGEVQGTGVKRTRARRMQRPPEVAATDIDRLFERIRTIAPPAKVDAAWARSFGLADATIILSWLGLADQGGTVEDPTLWNRVRMPATREEALAALVRKSYDRIFATVDATLASREDLEGAFVNAYNLGDTRRYIRAFARLCRHAGIQIAAFEPVGEAAVGSAPANPPGPKTVHGPGNTNRAKPKPMNADEISAAASTHLGPRRDVSQWSTAGINVNIEIPADWTEDQIRKRVAEVKKALAEVGD
jgi:hypothetical protein